MSIPCLYSVASRQGIFVANSRDSTSAQAHYSKQLVRCDYTKSLQMTVHNGQRDGRRDVMLSNYYSTASIPPHRVPSTPIKSIKTLLLNVDKPQEKIHGLTVNKRL